jgi:hypothetical protein
MHRKVQLIVSGGIRTGADVAKAMALGADAVAIGTAALIALGDNHPRLDKELKEIGSAAGYYDDWQNGRDPAGITTQDPELSKRLDPLKVDAIWPITCVFWSWKHKPWHVPAVNRICITGSGRSGGTECRGGGNGSCTACWNQLDSRSNAVLIQSSSDGD